MSVKEPWEHIDLILIYFRETITLSERKVPSKLTLRRDASRAAGRSGAALIITSDTQHRPGTGEAGTVTTITGGNSFRIT